MRDAPSDQNGSKSIRGNPGREEKVAVTQKSIRTICSIGINVRCDDSLL